MSEGAGVRARVAGAQGARAGALTHSLSARPEHWRGSPVGLAHACGRPGAGPGRREQRAPRLRPAQKKRCRPHARGRPPRPLPDSRRLGATQHAISAIIPGLLVASYALGMANACPGSCRQEPGARTDRPRAPPLRRGGRAPSPSTLHTHRNSQVSPVPPRPRNLTASYTSLSPMSGDSGSRDGRRVAAAAALSLAGDEDAHPICLLCVY